MKTSTDLKHSKLEPSKQNGSLPKTIHENSLSKVKSAFELNKSSSMKTVNNAIEAGLINVKPLKKVSFAKLIPKKLHFVWIGGRISEENLSHIKSFAAANPDYQVNIWTDRPMNIYRSEAFLDCGKFKFNIRNINQIQKLMTKGVGTYLSREMHGTYKNLAAASDVLRIFILS